DPAGVTMTRVESTAQLRAATLELAARADAVIMAAAPADYRPSQYRDTKWKKSDSGDQATLALTANPDIAAELGAEKIAGRLLVAFAAETHEGQKHAREKLTAKNADMIVLNEVGEGRAFGT